MLNFENGHSKTVYSLVWPKTEDVIRQTLSDVETMMARHRAPHRQQQDAFGPDFASAWWSWAGLESGSVHQWPEFYPTAGASEALREVINELSIDRGTLVVFDGEYEGYEAIAAGHRTRVVKIPRDNWQDAWQIELDRRSKINDHTPMQWWVSQPSALDGCWWDGFDHWLATVSSHPRMEVWVDLTYIGATPSHLHRALPLLTPARCAGLVWSLSKPAGMYYRRAGGCLSRRRIPGLWGNRWFKNIDSLWVAQQWLAHVPRGSIPDQYRSAQIDIINHWNGNNPENVCWAPSDVVLLANSKNRPHTEQDDRYRRGSGYRVCLTPSLHEVIYGS